LETIELTQAEVDELLEYSTSVPSGTTVGKRWKRDNNCLGQTGRPKADRDYIHATARMVGHEHDWVLGEFIECDPPRKDFVRILWRKIIIKEET
jgi:hypothetical protein